MKPIKKFASFDKLKKEILFGNNGITRWINWPYINGDIQWLGSVEDMQINFPTILEGFDKDTKFIVHGAKFIKEAQEDLCLIKMVILLD